MTILDFIKDRKLPLSLIERGAELPKNSLSRIVSGKRKLPRKHEKRVCKFLEGYGFKI
jgi:hypothetical protein